MLQAYNAHADLESTSYVDQKFSKMLLSFLCCYYYTYLYMLQIQYYIVIIIVI